jgi:hypothetical protein
MNVNMTELAKAFTAHAPETTTAPNPEPTPTPAPEPESAAEDKTSKPRRTHTAKTEKAAVDPMQWWGSLTQQFQNIASAAMQDVASKAMKAKAGEEAVTATAEPATKATRKPIAKTDARKKPAAKKTRSTRG